MDTLETIRRRCSVRRFQSTPVPPGHLAAILEAGRWAPSWANTQCVQLVVVTDAQVKGRLADTMTNPASPGANAARHAPVVIVVCAELGRAGYYHGQVSTPRGDWFMFDAALCTENMCLAAADLGLGTVILGLADQTKIDAILNLPSGTVSVAMVPLGYPEAGDPPPRTSRRELSQFVSQNSYGVR